MLLRSEIVQKRIYASVGIPFKGNFSLLRHGARKESARSCNPLTQGTPSFGLFLTQGTPSFGLFLTQGTPSFGLFAPLLSIFDHFEPSLQPVMGGCCKMFQLHSIKPHCAGRHFRTKLMSRYIGAGQNDRFDVRIQCGLIE